MINGGGVKKIELSKIESRSGNITVVDNSNSSIPFKIKRIFYLFDVPGGESRGAHAHKECHQFLIAASGSFEVILNDGNKEWTVFLNKANVGLYIPPLVWASEVNFSSGSICLVLASHTYTESDYIRQYNAFIDYINNA